MKRGKLLIISSVCIVLFVSLVSAGLFSDAWGKITGKATSGTASVNITIGNSAPTVTYVQIIAAQDPTISGATNITFNFTATDSDGTSNLNSSTATASFNKTGETTRTNSSCVAAGSSGNNKNYTCTISMYYYDLNGAWTINASIKDINGAYGSNNTLTVTYNLLTAMVMSPTSLTWPQVGLSDTDTGSNNDPLVVNNSGNDVDLSVNVTALNLRGETTTTDFIYANNFTVENATAGCSGTAMVNGTSTNVTSAKVQRGNNSLNFNNDTSGQEQVYFCLKGVLPTISAQAYSSSFHGAWTVAIIT